MKNHDLPPPTTKDCSNSVEKTEPKTTSEIGGASNMIETVKAAIKYIEGLIENHKPKRNKRVVMMPKTCLPVAYDNEEKYFYVSRKLEPELHSIAKSKRAIKAIGKQSEGKPIAVTKLEYLERKLALTKSALRMLENAAKEPPVSVSPETKAKRAKLRQLKKQYKEFSSEERETETAENIRKEIQRLMVELKLETTKQLFYNLSDEQKKSKVGKDLRKSIIKLLNKLVEIKGKSGEIAGDLHENGGI